MSNWSEIGSVLRAARENLRWSVQDISHRTRIPVQTLRGLEDGDYSAFPSPAYAKSFLTQYSDYLSVDASDWLDRFETGNVLSNLDSYGYLKDHDEHLGDEPVAAKRPARKQQKGASPTPTPAPVPATAPRSGGGLQPLLVFTITAALITGAVFGFIRLSEQFGESAGGMNAAEKNPLIDEDSQLRPLSSIPDARPATLDTSNVPRAVAVTSDPSADRPVESLGTGPLTAPPPIKDLPPPPAVVIDSDTPRAIIVDP